MHTCRGCKTENPEVNSKCFSCGKSLVLATLECITGEGDMLAGMTWKLFSKDYTLGRSKKSDIPIRGTYVSRHHGNLKYNSEENCFYYESFAKNPFEFEKVTYKVLDGAILPFPENIELKLNYLEK